MERRLALVVSANFIMCLTFAGQGLAVPEKCRTQPCNKVKFDADVHERCILPFNETMATIDYRLTCPWPATRRFCISLMLCFETLANYTCCTEVSHRHRLLMDIHKVYFSLCSYMKDPAVPVLLLLIVPCAIVPLMIPFLCQHFRLHEYRLPNTN